MAKGKEANVKTRPFYAYCWRWTFNGNSALSISHIELTRGATWLSCAKMLGKVEVKRALQRGTAKIVRIRISER